MTMLSEERRREILELLQTEGRVLVGDLSKRFRTSLITIRKDLEFLHHQGQLERTHGGAPCGKRNVCIARRKYASPPLPSA
jgi:DeoR/GlpR family transcriptional regulator of sugar metabolism